MKPNTQDCVRCRGRLMRFHSSPVLSLLPLSHELCDCALRRRRGFGFGQGSTHSTREQTIASAWWSGVRDAARSVIAPCRNSRPISKINCRLRNKPRGLFQKRHDYYTKIPTACVEKTGIRDLSMCRRGIRLRRRRQVGRRAKRGALRSKVARARATEPPTPRSESKCAVADGVRHLPR